MVVLGDVEKSAQSIADKLRAEGIKVAVDITGRKIDKQIKAAVKMKIPHLLFVGEEEVANGTYRLKDIATEQETTASIERIITTVADYRKRRNADEDDF
jgi:histidyl-tRNA synthetase